MDSNTPNNFSRSASRWTVIDESKRREKEKLEKLSEGCVLVTENSFGRASNSWERHKIDEDNHIEVCQPESKNHTSHGTNTMTVAALTGAATVYFGGMTAVANIVIAYQQYRARHPRRIITGARSDYVKLHEGYNLCYELFQADQRPFYMAYTERLLPPLSQGQRERRYSLTRLKSVTKRLGSKSTTSRQQQQLGGEIILAQIQKVPDTYRDSSVRLNTGKKPRYDINKAEDHWRTVEDGSACHNANAPTIAVVNWTTQIVTMFVKEKDWETGGWSNGIFFRNYQVRNANLLLFAQEYKQQLVFTGILDEEKLQGSTSPILIVEDDRTCTLKSTNCWTLIGLPGATRGEDFMFLEMERAALFGLVECRFQDPTLLNVDMRNGGNGSGMEFVHVDSPDPIRLSYAPSCIFSVFAFSAEAYAKDRVLIG